LLTTLRKQAETRILLLIDQFEEVFTQTVSEDERRHFLELLLTACTEPDGPGVLLLTLRADFYDRPLHYPEFGKLIDENHIVMFPMETRDVRDVIEKPARLPDVQLTFEEDLVGDLLFDVFGQPGALPLLQFTLDQLYQRRKDQQLTRQAYQDIGGVRGALAHHAETIYAALPSEDHRQLTRALFLRLLNPGTTDQDVTRRRVPLSDLILVDPQQTTWLKQVIDTFVQQRLLVANTVAETSTVEIAHEALI